MTTNTRKILTKSEQEALVALAAKGNVKAQNDLLIYHEPFMVNKAAKYSKGSPKLDYDDLLMAARYGMLKAIGRFDPLRGVSFLTYAGYWIMNEIRTEAAKFDIIWVPSYHSDKSRNSNDNHFNAAQRAWNVKSLPTVKNVDDDGNYVWEPIYPEDQTIYDSDDHAKLNQAMRQLDPKLAKIITLRYFDGLSLMAIGKRYNITKERIRQLLLVAIEQLRRLMKVDADCQDFGFKSMRAAYKKRSCLSPQGRESIARSNRLRGNECKESA